MRIQPANPFQHIGLPYTSDEQYLAGVVPFIQTAAATGEPVLAAVPAPRVALLGPALGARAANVTVTDTADIGHHPGRILPNLLLRFADQHPGQPVHIVSEAGWPAADSVGYPAFLTYDSLVNLAFAGRAATILCPVHVDGRHSQSLADLRCNHPYLADGATTVPNGGYVAPADLPSRPLSDPPAASAVLRFQDASALGDIRRFVRSHAAAARLDADKAADLLIAVNELACNSVEHAGGPAVLSAWTEDGMFVCQIRDGGHLTDPLVGQLPVTTVQERGRGMLLVNDLCDLVLIHSAPGDTAIRVYSAL